LVALVGEADLAQGFLGTRMRIAGGTIAAEADLDIGENAGPGQQPRLLERVWRDQGFTAILVTHDVSEAVALADRVLVIEEGRIAHDVTVNAARPRQRGSAELASLEGSILSHLLSADDRT
jgi:hypothetical protein